LTDLRESTLETFFKICPKELILDHHQTFRKILIKTRKEPSTIIYSGLSDETEEESSKGKECGWFWIDEPSEVKLSPYLMYLAQLCWQLPGGQYPPFMAMLTSNPEPGWVMERFLPLIEESSDTRPCIRQGAKVFVRALPKDNPYLPPGWLEQMSLDAPESWKKKYLEGSWEVSEGQVFKEFDRAVHTIPVPSAEFLSRLKLVASIDHATTGTTCMVIAGIDPDANLFVLGEYYEKNKLISEHAQGMCRLMDFWVKKCGKEKYVSEKAVADRTVHPSTHAFEYILIDPSTQSKTQQNKNELWSHQDMYRREGIPTIPAWNAIDAGVNMLQEYLHVKPTHIHPLSQKRGSPSIFILADTNRSGIKELIGWRKTISDNGQIKYVGPDHWIDNVRYIAMSRPEPPRFTIKDMLSMDTTGRIAQNALDRWAAKFGVSPNENQWFAGGSGSENAWYARPN
jgi:hypothetical protein